MKCDLTRAHSSDADRSRSHVDLHRRGKTNPTDRDYGAALHARTRWCNIVGIEQSCLVTVVRTAVAPIIRDTDLVVTSGTYFCLQPSRPSARRIEERFRYSWLVFHIVPIPRPEHRQCFGRYGRTTSIECRHIQSKRTV